jgi:hypothetical protein
MTDPSQFDNLEALYRSGVLSEAEYQAARARLIEQTPEYTVAPPTERCRPFKSKCTAAQRVQPSLLTRART